MIALPQLANFSFPFALAFTYHFSYPVLGRCCNSISIHPSHAHFTPPADPNTANAPAPAQQEPAPSPALPPHHHLLLLLFPLLYKYTPDTRTRDTVPAADRCSGYFSWTVSSPPCAAVWGRG
ncbi:uncharacterized protein GGS25DRAFT_39976 [Hypoxylon fragiforme]|uniref:uncharacterized protein n=1 Tax=Hypoxylon fragiforme TaxID=63214 RepID=UPI0020C5DF5E|nr:uncharacterized protein GGS25DRAFT_39976 [Hypoxylon fragiforme]KAI2614228.1 hypothetical protein GGS25DRAFT_39976 [Hypoxylon fragiforme]